MLLSLFRCAIPAALAFAVMSLPLAWRTQAAMKWESDRAQALSMFPPPEPTSAHPGAEPIDRILGTKAPRCSDVTFLRRIHLDVVGVGPTIAEQEAFAKDDSPDRRNAEIERLLADLERQAVHWLPFWEDALASNPLRIPVGGIGNNGDLRPWLLASLRAGKPYDVMAAELLNPMLPAHPQTLLGVVNGSTFQVGYLRSDTRENALRSAANITQFFLGASVRCGSCHDHFERPAWTLERVTALAGMIAERDLEIVRCERPTGKVAAAAYAFDESSAGIPFVARGARARQSELARRVADPRNPRLSRTFINRLWKRLTGEGLFEPLDDAPDEMTGPRGELLTWLADDFARSRYDVRHAMRRIVRSAFYQGESFAATAPAADESPRLVQRRLSAEQWLDSLDAALSQRTDRIRTAFIDAPSPLLVKLNKPSLPRAEVCTERSREFDALAALELIAGKEFRDKMKVPAEWTALPDAEAAREVYRALVGRAPDRDELAVALEHLGGGERAQRLADLAWALIVGPEFSFIP